MLDIFSKETDQLGGGGEPCQTYINMVHATQTNDNATSNLTIKPRWSRVSLITVIFVALSSTAEPFSIVTHTIGNNETFVENVLIKRYVQHALILIIGNKERSDNNYKVITMGINEKGKFHHFLEIWEKR